MQPAKKGLNAFGEYHARASDSSKKKKNQSAVARFFGLWYAVVHLTGR
jgi:hypothetical protein